jgi:hypothetical protein
MHMILKKSVKIKTDRAKLNICLYYQLLGLAITNFHLNFTILNLSYCGRKGIDQLHQEERKKEAYSKVCRCSMAGNLRQRGEMSEFLENICSPCCLG